MTTSQVPANTATRWYTHQQRPLVNPGFEHVLVEVRTTGADHVELCAVAAARPVQQGKLGAEGGVGVGVETWGRGSG
ncbi:hypothetical protein HCA58_08810 [Micromonospora sp. HNM0581]|uniref:hypothetical protein n=1 Tax=Micromonospora sp. HNM0581 TaxID=2716341 RepID=UPI00146E8B7A|nr:hypothetical protein [Micromonospora sp. HNM0581]NLU78478.1 hypothetical protein [Micromonospora sp. HNM0581]